MSVSERKPSSSGVVTSSLTGCQPNEARHKNREHADGKAGCTSVKRLFPYKRASPGGQLPVDKQDRRSSLGNGRLLLVRCRVQRSPTIAEAGDERELFNTRTWNEAG